MRHILAPSALLFAGVATAQPTTAPYRALGTEPFWNLTIDQRTMRLEELGRRPVTVARPTPRHSFNGERYVAGGMVVDVRHAKCSDGMSDRVFRDTVTVQIGGRTLRGCGAVETSEASRLTDTRWTVTALNGRSVHTERSLTVSFTSDRVEGRLCNTFRGPFTLRGDRLTVGPVAATRMACEGPSMAVENALFALWRQPARVAFARDGSLTIRGARDRVTLRRVR